MTEKQRRKYKAGLEVALEEFSVYEIWEKRIASYEEIKEKLDAELKSKKDEKWKFDAILTQDDYETFEEYISETAKRNIAGMEDAIKALEEERKSNALEENENSTRYIINAIAKINDEISALDAKTADATKAWELAIIQESQADLDERDIFRKEIDEWQREVDNYKLERKNLEKQLEKLRNNLKYARLTDDSKLKSIQEKQVKLDSYVKEVVASAKEEIKKKLTAVDANIEELNSKLVNHEEANEDVYKATKKAYKDNEGIIKASWNRVLSNAEKLEINVEKQIEGTDETYYLSCEEIKKELEKSIEEAKLKELEEEKAKVEVPAEETVEAVEEALEENVATESIEANKFGNKVKLMGSRAIKIAAKPLEYIKKTAHVVKNALDKIIFVEVEENAEVVEDTVKEEVTEVPENVKLEPAVLDDDYDLEPTPMVNTENLTEEETVETEENTYVFDGDEVRPTAPEMEEVKEETVEEKDNDELLQFVKELDPVSTNTLEDSEPLDLSMLEESESVTETEESEPSMLDETPVTEDIKEPVLEEESKENLEEAPIVQSFEETPEYFKELEKQYPNMAYIGGKAFKIKPEIVENLLSMVEGLEKIK